MKKVDKKIIIPIIVFFLLICLGAVGYLVFKNINIMRSYENYHALQTVPSDEQKNTDPSMEAPRIESPADFQRMMSVNSEIYAWLSVPDTNIDYPVVQSEEDDNFYLDHDIYKDYSFPGTIYSQSCNTRDWRDRVTVLYGHNMLNGSMFATLHRFRDTDFFNSHPYFYIYTQGYQLTYEIVTAFDYDDRHIMNSFDFKDDRVFQEWLNAAKRPQDLYANVRQSTKLDLNSKFVVLSTCQDSGDGRYLVQGVLIKSEPTKIVETNKEISENG